MHYALFSNGIFKSQDGGRAKFAENFRSSPFKNETTFRLIYLAGHWTVPLKSSAVQQILTPKASGIIYQNDTEQEKMV
jgi:hypothetical protein